MYVLLIFDLHFFRAKDILPLIDACETHQTLAASAYPITPVLPSPVAHKYMCNRVVLARKTKWVAKRRIKMRDHIFLGIERQGVISISVLPPNFNTLKLKVQCRKGRSYFAGCRLRAAGNIFAGQYLRATFLRANFCGPKFAGQYLRAKFLRANICGPKFAGQYLRANICGPKFAGQYLRANICGPISAGQNLRANICGPKFVGQNLRANICGPMFAGQNLRANICGPKFAGQYPRATFLQAKVCGHYFKYC